MSTDLMRNLLLNWMADLSGDWMTHFSGNSPGNWNLDGVTGNILDRPCGGDTSGLNAGHTDLFWYMTDNSVADLARNRDTDLMGDWDTDLAGHRNADLTRNGTRSLNWDLLALPFSVGLTSWTRVSNSSRVAIESLSISISLRLSISLTLSKVVSSISKSSNMTHSSNMSNSRYMGCSVN